GPPCVSAFSVWTSLGDVAGQEVSVPEATVTPAATVTGTSPLTRVWLFGEPIQPCVATVVWLEVSVQLTDTGDAASCAVPPSARRAKARPEIAPCHCDQKDGGPRLSASKYWRS